MNYNKTKKGFIMKRTKNKEIGEKIFCFFIALSLCLFCQLQFSEIVRCDYVKNQDEISEVRKILEHCCLLFSVLAILLAIKSILTTGFLEKTKTIDKSFSFLLTANTLFFIYGQFFCAIDRCDHNGCPSVSYFCLVCSISLCVVYNVSRAILFNSQEDNAESLESNQSEEIDDISNEQK